MENDFIRVIFHISLTTSVIIGLLLLLMPLLNKRYPSQWRYYVWLIITVRLLIPINISLPKTVVNIPAPEIVIPKMGSPVTFEDEETSVTKPPDEKLEAVLRIDEKPYAIPSPIEMAIPSEQTIFSPASEQEAVFSFIKLLGGIWLSGMIILLLVQAYVYIKFLRKLYYYPRYETPVNIQEALWQAGKELKIARLPEIRVCGAAPSPILTGVFHPVLLLPHEKYKERELLFILRHELVHFRRRDLFYKLLITAVKVVHWFNPFVWLMAAQADRDVEISCDDLVMDGVSDDDRMFYGDTILNTLPIKSKWRLEPVFTTSFGSAKNNMKYRLKNLFDRSMKKRGIAAFCVVLLITGLISGIVAVTPAIAAGSEPGDPLSNTVFSNNDDGASRVMLGPYALKKDESCTVTIIWNEGGTQTLQFIKETSTGKESAARTEHRITSRTPLTVTAWEDGNYRFVIPAGKSMTGIVCIVDYAGADASDKISAGKEYVSFDEVEILTYENNGAPYIHDIRSNHTKRNIVGYERGMLAFDKNGQPLKIKWIPFDSDGQSAYYYLHSNENDRIPAGTTANIHGGWSLDGSTEPSQSVQIPGVVKEIKYILYNLKQITFDDGTVWVNPDYENWLKTYEGKKADINVLNKYYPHTMEIRQADIKIGGAGRLDIAEPVQDKLPFSVAAIEPNQVVCIGKIQLEPGIAYTGSVSAENGSGIVAALHESPDITRYSPNVLWTQHFGSGDGKNIYQLYFYAEKPTTYYVYVGSADTRLTNVTGNLNISELIRPSVTNGLNDVYKAAIEKSSDKKIAADFNNGRTNTTGNIVINLSNKNTFNIAESGSFQAKSNQVLDLDIISSIKGGTVDLFLFDPNGKEQRITIGSSNLTKEVKLSEGLWQYNCSGIFRDGGNIKIVGTIK